MTMNEIIPLSLTLSQLLDEARIPPNSVIFRQNDRWVYRTDSTIGSQDATHFHPIETLGPFDTHAVDISFTLSDFDSQYTINKIKGRSLPEEDRPVGTYTPLALVTLEGAARSTANIPEDATHFCWLYPPNSIPTSPDIDLDDSDELNLLKIGGFAYFQNHDNSQFRILSVNSLKESAENGLVFESRHLWPGKFTEQLRRQNRFHRITIASLHQKGARYFGFINPNESLLDNDDESPWMPPPNGAFVYLFNDDYSPHQFDCYFTVADNCLGVAPSDEQ